MKERRNTKDILFLTFILYKNLKISIHKCDSEKKQQGFKFFLTKIIFVFFSVLYKSEKIRKNVYLYDKINTIYNRTLDFIIKKCEVQILYLLIINSHNFFVKVNSYIVKFFDNS